MLIHWPLMSQRTLHQLRKCVYLHTVQQVTRAVTAQSVERWAMGWTIGTLGFDFWRRLGLFFFFHLLACSGFRTCFCGTNESILTVCRTLWTGDRPDTRSLPTQDNTRQKNADTYPCLERYSNPRSQCSSGAELSTCLRLLGHWDRLYQAQSLLAPGYNWRTDHYLYCSL
jgi:hypothetical protein